MDAMAISSSQAESVPGLGSTHSDSTMSQTELTMANAPTTSPSTTRRKASTKSVPPGMKRAMSTPNVRSMAGDDALAASLAEKRRNKLGYHRTSVACGHCRRRKIRCLLASEDPQKCQACIRLKKECNFFPVDQHPVADRPPRSESKIESSSNDAGTSDASSPDFMGGRTIEQVDQYPLPLQASPSSGSLQNIQSFSSLNASLTSPTDKAPLSAPLYNYQPVYERSGRWTSSPFTHQSPQTLLPNALQHEDLPYWYKPDSSMPLDYQNPQYCMAPSASHSQSANSSIEQFPTSGTREDHNWHPGPPNPPLRSMSLRGPEELPVHYQDRYLQSPSVDFGQSMTNSSDMQRPPLSSNPNSSIASSEYQPVPSTDSFPDQSGQHMQLGYQMPWSSMPLAQSPHMLTVGPENYGQSWYLHSPGLMQVKEEDPNAEFQRPPYPTHMPYQAGTG